MMRVDDFPPERRPMHAPDHLRPVVLGRRFSFALLAVLLAIAGLAGLATADDAEEEKQIEKLITQLGDDDYDVRKAAEKKLIAIGENVIPPLRKAAAKHS